MAYRPRAAPSPASGFSRGTCVSMSSLSTSARHSAVYRFIHPRTLAPSPPLVNNVAVSAAVQGPEPLLWAPAGIQPNYSQNPGDPRRGTVNAQSSNRQSKVVLRRRLRGTCLGPWVPAVAHHGSYQGPHPASGTVHLGGKRAPWLLTTAPHHCSLLLEPDTVARSVVPPTPRPESGPREGPTTSSNRTDGRQTEREPSRAVASATGPNPEEPCHREAPWVTQQKATYAGSR